MGTRLGRGPKCLLRIGDRSLLEILVDTLSPLVDEVLVAIPKGYEQQAEAALQSRGSVIIGGATRQQSIDRLIEASTADLLLIQDAARPFPSAQLCTDVLAAARQYDAAGAFQNSTEPVGRIDGNRVASCLDRHEAGIFQAPQAFTRNTLLEARQRCGDREYQSTAQMLIAAGYALRTVPGEPRNIKITTPLDWQIATRVIAPGLGLDHSR